jgi:hypothetical protein
MAVRAPMVVQQNCSMAPLTSVASPSTKATKFNIAMAIIGLMS